MQSKSDKLFIKPRNARLEREEDDEIHDDNSHLWAVAYSDLLMVLLSFFILFSTIDTKKQSSLLIDLAQNFDKSGTGSTSDRKENQLEKSGQKVDIRSIEDKLKSMNVTYIKEKEFMTIHFSEQLFGNAQFIMNESQKKQVSEVLEKILPYKNKINIYFEGHSDSNPIASAKNKIVQDNYVLSSLRGTQALHLAKELGFDEKYLFAQGSSSNIRNSRSLSLKIEPREEL